MKREDLAGMIYDALADEPDGLTMSQITNTVHMPRSSCNIAIRTLRLTLAEDGDTLWVTCDPAGQRQEWVYRLVDGQRLVDAGESGWSTNRILDAQSRVHLLAASMKTAVEATDGRTTLGRKARHMERVLRHLDEDLTALDRGE